MNSLVKDAEIFINHNYFTKDEADKLFSIVDDAKKFKRHILYFPNHKTQSWRKSYWFGDYPQAVQECGKKLPTDFVTNYKFHPEILKLKERLEKDFNVRFNSCLVGRFETPHDKIGFHSDNSTNMGADPYIASVSFGRPRLFKIKKQKKYGDERINITLKHGTVLIMRKNSNKKYLHSVPKDKGCNEENPRINLTFRNYLYHDDEINWSKKLKPL